MRCHYIFNNLKTYKDFRAEGAFLITASRKNGKTEFITIKSLAGEPCIVVTDISSPVFKGKRQFAATALSESMYKIDLQKGEEVIIYSKGTQPDFTIRPVNNSRTNCFGKKKQS